MSSAVYFPFEFVKHCDAQRGAATFYRTRWGRDAFKNQSWETTQLFKVDIKMANKAPRSRYYSHVKTFTSQKRLSNWETMGKLIEEKFSSCITISTFIMYHLPHSIIPYSGKNHHSLAGSLPPASSVWCPTALFEETDGFFSLLRLSSLCCTCCYKHLSHSPLSQDEGSQSV